MNNKMSNSSADYNTTSVNDTIGHALISLPDNVLILYNVYLSATIAFGGLGNILVVLVYIKSGSISGTDWFIIFISIFDLISSLFSVPVYLTFSTGAWKYYGTDFICRFHMFLSQSVVLSSTFLICGLATERYYKVCQPNSTSFTQTKSRNKCMVISAASAILSVPCFILYHNVHMQCINVTEGILVKLLMAYYTVMLLSYLSAVVILIFTHSRIVLVILRSEINILHHRKGSNGKQLKIKRRFDAKKRFSAFLNTVSRRNKIHVSQNSLDDSTKMELASKIGPNENAANGCSEDSNTTKNQVSYDVHTDTRSPTVTVMHIDSKHDNTSIHSVYGLSGEKPTKNKQFLGPPTVLKNALVAKRVRRIGWDSSGDQSSTLSNQPTEMSVRPTVTSTAVDNIQRINENRRLRHSLKTTRIAFLICLIFVLSWIPPWVSFINFMFMSPTTKMNTTYVTINMFCRMTYLVNTFSNPFLYTTLNKKFRDKLQSFLCWR